jgi:hypothetical protein
VEALLERTDTSSVVFAMGNIAGPGLALVDYFETHGRAVPREEPVEPLTILGLAA